MPVTVRIVLPGGSALKKRFQSSAPVSDVLALALQEMGMPASSAGRIRLLAKGLHAMRPAAALGDYCDEDLLQIDVESLIRSVPDARRALRAKAGAPIAGSGLQLSVSAVRVISGSYAAYAIDVVTDAGRWSVEQRFSAFAALATQLGPVAGAPLPPKGCSRKLGDAGFLERRRVALNEYAVALCRSGVLSDALLAFLGVLPEPQRFSSGVVSSAAATPSSGAAKGAAPAAAAADEEEDCAT